jgi:hypothetical protein
MPNADMIREAKPPRIVIYGVGQYSAMIARLAADRGRPIVAAFNRAGPKASSCFQRQSGRRYRRRPHRDLLSADMAIQYSLADSRLNDAVLRRRMAGYFALLETLEKQAVHELP